MPLVAVRRSTRQYAEMRAFLLDLYRRSGAGTQAELAKAAGVHTVNLSKWLSGKEMPEGYNLMKVIVAAARMAAQNSPPGPERDGALELLSGGDDVETRLATLEDEVRQLARADAVSLGFQSVEAAIAKLTEQLGGQAGQTETNP